MNTSKNKILFGLLVVAVVASIGLFLFNPFKTQDRIKPRVGDVIESIYGLGTVTANKVFHLRGGITLTVKKVFVKEGDTVAPGEPLIQMDESVMRSPIDGTVTSVVYKVGELASPQVDAVTVTNLKSLYLEVSLEQQSILRVKKDQKVLVSFESLRNEKCEGVVSSVYPRENQFIVRIEIDTWPAGVLPGMTGDVAILVGKKTDVLLIPLRSVVAGQVIRIRDGKKEKVPIKLGTIDGEWGEVISDNISQNDELLTRK